MDIEWKKERACVLARIHLCAYECVHWPVHLAPHPRQREYLNEHVQKRLGACATGARTYVRFIQTSSLASAARRIRGSLRKVA